MRGRGRSQSVVCGVSAAAPLIMRPADNGAAVWPLDTRLHCSEATAGKSTAPRLKSSLKEPREGRRNGYALRLLLRAALNDQFSHFVKQFGKFLP